MRKMLIGFVLVTIVAGVAYLHIRSHQVKSATEKVYAGNRQVILWSTTAQVREPVATVNFGDALDVLTRAGEQVQVRTSAGVTGWADEHDLLASEFWEKAQQLSAKTSALPVEAHGRTRVLSNLHLDPSRDSTRIRQLDKGIPVEIFERETAEIPGSSTHALAASPPAGNGDQASGEAPTEPKKEDWWLVRADLPDQTSQSGWILGRFIDLNVPEPLPDYASAAGMRIVAYFELNKVDDPGGAKPQYLVVGARGSEGQACDFTLLRVFTWGTQRQRYETAFVDSNVCGKLPVNLTHPAGGDVTFAFQDFSEGPPQNLEYRMHQTIVRRVGARQGARVGARETVAPRRKRH